MLTPNKSACRRVALLLGHPVEIVGVTQCFDNALPVSHRRFLSSLCVLTPLRRVGQPFLGHAAVLPPPVCL